MIQLRNNISFDFVAASGALGFDGLGWFWEKPLRWIGILNPHDFLVIFKTVTAQPLVGNLKMWCPWRCVRLIKGGSINAVGLTNPGIDHWIEFDYPRAIRHNIIGVPSIMPKTPTEAARMAIKLNRLRLIAGIELNVSCPNVDHDSGVKHVVDIVQACRDYTNHPLFLKLGPFDPIEEICAPLAYAVDVWDLTNTAPWDKVFPNQPSPLAKYGLMGGISGEDLAPLSLLALKKARKALGSSAKIITGGGIMSLQDVLHREEYADAFSFGVLFLRQPWMPNRIVSAYRHLCKASPLCQPA